MEQALCPDSPLFAGVTAAELPPLLQCLQAQRRAVARGETIFAAGDPADRLGIVLSGRVLTVYADMFGGSSILGAMEAGQLFGDAFSCSAERRMPVSVVAQSDGAVLLIGIERILHACGHLCPPHLRLTENLVHILADKYLAQSRKMIHLSGRSTRRKLLSYLSGQMREAGGPFTVPLNRQELADYLFVDRTGLSAEWNRLLREGLLRPEGARFTLSIPPCLGLDCAGTDPS